jgi:hypothetical protein
LTVRLHSTWGDPHFVGLAGVDVFDSEGRSVVPVSVAAPDVSMQAGSESDPRYNACFVVAIARSALACVFVAGVAPSFFSLRFRFQKGAVVNSLLLVLLVVDRTADKLVDSVPHTCDDLHAWLCPWPTGNGGDGCGDGDVHGDGDGGGDGSDGRPGPVFVDVDFDLGRSTRLGMVRIWNYNAVRAARSNVSGYVRVGAL